MSRFVNFEKVDPYRMLGAFVRRSRIGLTSAYEAAFAAASRCEGLLRRHADLSFGEHSESWRHAALDTYVEAQAEDLQADLHATTVVLAADDALRRFAFGIGAGPMSIDPGFGPSYGRGVRFSRLLWAGANAVRHVSDWDEANFPFPYRVSEQLDAKADRDEIRALRTIRVIQDAFGIGIHERVRDVVSWRIVVAVDGKLGTERPDFGRFEKAFVDTAFEVADAAPDEQAQKKLREALDFRFATI